MFFCAIARPRYDYTTKKWFDGKLGIWAFCETTKAKRNSKNRPAGTPVISQVSVTAKAYRAMVLKNLLPSIKNKWPGRNPQQIFIQEDNAPVHSASIAKVVAQEAFLKHSLHVQVIK